MRVVQDSSAPLQRGVLPCQVQVLGLEGPDCGQVLATAPVPAPHCLTSIQFSPSSRLLLLAYGRCWIVVMPGSGLGQACSLPVTLCVVQSRSLGKAD